MIPTNRRVIGSDLEDLREKLGVNAQEMALILGLSSINKWSEIAKKGADKPVDDVNVSMIVRLLDAHPEFCLIPKMPSPEEIYNKVNEISGEKISYKYLSVLLGGEGSSGHRWLETGGRPSPSVQRTCYLFERFLAQFKNKKKGLEDWENIVNVEAFSRNASDVWVTGKWKKKPKTEALDDSED